MTPDPQGTRGRFPLGQLVVTRNAADRLTATEIAHGLHRHAAADWGDLAPEDIAENELALRDGFRLFSAYGQGDHRFWVITEADRSVTTVLLPDDY
jgi:hypothetical protein